MPTDQEAWDIVIDHMPAINRTVNNVALKGQGLDLRDLQSYAVESAFRAARAYSQDKGRLESLMMRAARFGTIDGIRELTRFYGTSRHSMQHRYFVQDPHDTAFWEMFDGDEEVGKQVEFMAMLEPLTERQRKMMYLHFYERWTNVEIGDMFGITNSRVSQIIVDCCRTLGRVDEEGRQALQDCG